MAPRQTITRPAGWRPGATPRWRSDLSVAALAGEPPVVPLGSFAGLDTTPTGRVRPRLAAVLVALTDALPGQPGTHVLVTRRSDHLRNHAGEVSFPGGRVEPGERPGEAALREAWEEVALDPTAVDLRGELPHVQTYMSGSHIVPVIGVVSEPPVLDPNPGEVEEVYWVPLAQLVEPGVHHRELWTREAQPLAIDFFELRDDIIWGATARMLVTLLALGE